MQSQGVYVCQAQVPKWLVWSLVAIVMHWCGMKNSFLNFDLYVVGTITTTPSSDQLLDFWPVSSAYMVLWARHRTSFISLYNHMLPRINKALNPVHCLVVILIILLCGSKLTLICIAGGWFERMMNELSNHTTGILVLAGPTCSVMPVVYKSTGPTSHYPLPMIPTSLPWPILRRTW